MQNPRGMMRRTHSWLLLLTFTACADRATGETQTAAIAADSAMSGQGEAALAATLFDGAGAARALPATAADMAQWIANRGRSLTPAGCATSTQSGGTATIVFDHCTGSHGLVTIDGTVLAKITSVSASTVGFQITADQLQLGGAALDVAITGTYSSIGGTQSLAVTSTSTGTGALGNAVTHDGDYTATWDGTCATVDGTWSTSIGDRDRGLDVSLTRCTAACPRGQVTRTDARGKTISLSFDGTATASWSSSTGRSGELHLGCGQ